MAGPFPARLNAVPLRPEFRGKDAIGGAIAWRSGAVPPTAAPPLAPGAAVLVAAIGGVTALGLAIGA
jgi:hypothetical protein